jgi:hypothetical protein
MILAFATEGRKVGTNMNLQEFADRYQLKIKKDSCDDLIIPGRVKGRKRPEDNHHVFEHAGKFFVYFDFDTVGRWNSTRKRLQELGAQPVVTGRYDGYLLFNPEVEPLVKLALKLAKIRTKRQLTPEQKAEIRERFKKKA